jgi:AsmA protein
MTNQRERASFGDHAPRWAVLAGYVGLCLACVVLGAITFLIVASPVDLARDRVLQELRTRTGRDVAVTGATSLNFFPRPGLSLSGLTLAAPADMGGAATMTMQSLDAEVGFASLLGGQPNLKRLTLTRPAIELRVDAQGRRSWDIGPQAQRPLRQPAAPTSAAPARRSQDDPVAEKANVAAMLDQIGLESVRIVDGRVRYIDERIGLRQEIEAVNVELSLGGATDPLQAKGNLTVQGEPMAFEATLAPLLGLFDERKARLTLKLAGRPLEAAYDGRVGLVGGAGIEGNLSLKADSTAAAAQWLGRPIAGGRDPGPLSLSAAVAASETRTSLTNLVARIGESAMEGTMTVEARQPRPYLRGSLKVADFDLGRFLLRPGAGPAPGARPAPQASAPAPSRRAETPPGPKRSGDWSDDVIDLGPFGLADADLGLSVDRLTYKDLKTGAGRLTLALKDSVAKIELEQLELYGGRARGVVILDGAGAVPVTSTNLSLDGVSTLPLLKDTMGFEWLDGRGTITLALAGQGASERQIVSALNGKMSLSMANGTLTGVDVGKLLRAVEQVRFGDLKPAPGDKTPFSEFAGTFVITNGLAQNQDMRLVSPRVQLTGSGSVNLAQRQIDYTARARIAGGTPGQGNVVSFGNLEIPVRIEGSWTEPNLSVPGQEQLTDTVKQIGKNLKSQEVQDALKGILGGGDGQQKVNPREFFEKLLKKP